LFTALPAGATSATATAALKESSPPAIAWSVNVPLAYVARVFRTVPYAHADAAPLLVLAKLLRANFLHREIREKGGAYGGLAGYNADGGLLSLLSYRDPHLLRTLEVYRQAIDWACVGEFSAEMMQEAILAAFGELDRPLSPGGRGHREFLYHRQGISLEMRQAFRDRLLTCDQAAVRRVAAVYLRDELARSAVGILAGDELLAGAHAELDAIGTHFARL
jgi:Zn-dependent M16 (insulinase) family peptidase